MSILCGALGWFDDESNTRQPDEFDSDAENELDKTEKYSELKVRFLSWPQSAGTFPC